MHRHKAYRFRLEPTAEQMQAMSLFARAASYVWNYMLEEAEGQYRMTGQMPSANDQKRGLTYLKRCEGYEWLNSVHAGMLQQEITHLHFAYFAFFRRVRGGAKYKGKPKRKTRHNSFSYPTGIKVRKGEVYLPKIGWVAMRQSRAIEGTVSRATVSQKASGWYVSLSVQVEINESEHARDTVLGVVLTPKSALLSDGRVFLVPRRYWKAIERLSALHNALKRKEPASNRHKELRIKIARQGERIGNIWFDFLHKLSHTLTSEAGIILVNDFPAANNGEGVQWGELLRQLEYKSAWRGCQLHCLSTPVDGTVEAARQLLIQNGRGVPVR